MRTVSLEALQEREARLHDTEYDLCEGMSEQTSVDRYMEVNRGRMGIDSEEAAVREKHTRKVLSERPLPDYQPFE